MEDHVEGVAMLPCLKPGSLSDPLYRAQCSCALQQCQ